MTTPTLEQPITHQPLATGVSTLHNISWEQFKTIEATLNQGKGVKLSYLNGTLEIMAPIGQEHESVKSTLGILLEAYMREKGIRFYCCGGFTLESPETASGTPDESYAIGTPKDIPDIVIEVIVTSGKFDKVQIYQPKGVPEVWFWKKGQITVFHLTQQGYEQRDRSQFLPELKLDVLKSYLDYPDQYDAVTNLITAVRQGNL